MLLEALGCQFVSVEAERESEPVPEQLGALIAEVHRGRRDVGFAQDLDGDRLALITETGTPPGEDATLVLVVAHLLSRGGKATVVTNSQTTRAVADVAAQSGADLVEVPVGEVNLSRALGAALARGARAFGGEGNGGVIYPPVSLGRDSLIGIALVLEALASGPATLSQRLRALPRYEGRKLKLPKVALEPLYERVIAAFPDANVSRLDGLKLVFADGAWLSLRPSNTEPVVRLVAESRSSAWLDDAVAKVTSL
jgi:phosphomannomutase